MGEERSTPLSLDAYVAGVRAGDRPVLGRAITLVESDREDQKDVAQELLAHLLPYTGRAHRVGISGVPGVGKSTFIDALGTLLTGRGQRVAVLAVDPTSAVSGGSILGDKTRMARLGRDPNAFIRPSPTGGTLGGVARKTREAMLVCEAAGFDVVLVETVGVGQSETLVSEMVDFYLVLLLAGAGDELQGIKRGILELADMLAINKADGDNEERAERARRAYARAIRLVRPPRGPWKVPVVTCSALTGAGIEALWERVEAHRQIFGESGELDRRRREQLVRWMWAMVEEGLLAGLRNRPAVRDRVAALEAEVRALRTTPTAAARALLAAAKARR